MKNTVSFEIGNTKSNIILANRVSEKHINGTHNANVVFCAHNYVKIGDVVTMEVAKRGNKAADTFFAAIRNIEERFEVKSDFVKGGYLAIILGVKLKVV